MLIELPICCHRFFIISFLLNASSIYIFFNAFGFIFTVLAFSGGSRVCLVNTICHLIIEFANLQHRCFFSCSIAEVITV